MTVIVIYEDYDTKEIKITGDGRTSQDWMGIFSDETTKVFRKKDFIYGSCGDASSKAVIPELLRKTKCNKMALLNAIKDEEFKDILPNCKTFYAHKTKGMAIMTVDAKNSKDDYGKISILPLEYAQLPQAIGSGFLNVRTLLGNSKKVTQRDVEKAIRDSYKHNHTIGGKVSTVVLKYKRW